MTSPEAPFFDGAPCGLFATLPDGLVTAANDTLLRWLGRRREEVVGQARFVDLLTAPGRILFETHYAPLLRMQGRIDEVAVEFDAGGEPLPAFLSSVEERDAGGAVRLVRSAAMSAVERRRYERELLVARRMAEQGMRAKADLMGVFAHDVRNALSATGMTAALLASEPLPEKQRERVRRLSATVERVGALLDEMLVLGRIEAGKATLDIRRFDLRELIASTILLFASEAEAKKVALEARLAEDVPQFVLGDPVKIGQVLANLLGNGLKFTGAGSVTLRVSTVRRSGQSVVLAFAVADTGIGIASERIERIFEPYAQAGPEIGQTYGGTGLGLAISRKILELHGSRLTVSSRPGKGSTFAFELSLGLPP
jgi:signal transduction histidine kinase